MDWNGWKRRWRTMTRQGNSFFEAVQYWMKSTKYLVEFVKNSKKEIRTNRRYLLPPKLPRSRRTCRLIISSGLNSRIIIMGMARRNQRMLAFRISMLHTLSAVWTTNGWKCWERMMGNGRGRVISLQRTFTTVTWKWKKVTNAMLSIRI